MNAELNQKIITEGVNMLLKNAFDRMANGRDSWDAASNPFVPFMDRAIRDQEDNIKESLGKYIMEVVDSDDFRLAVKSEYTKKLAQAMISNLGIKQP